MSALLYQMKADSPLGLWPMQEAAGSSSVRDVSGNGVSLTPASVTFGAATVLPVGVSASFTASTSHMDSASGLTGWDGAALAVECWAACSTSGQQQLLDRDPDPGTLTNRRFQFRLFNGNLQFIVFIGGAAYTVTSPLTYIDGNMHHFVGTYDGSTISAAVDGVVIATLAQAGSAATGGGTPLRVGYHPNANPTTGWLTGRMAWAAVYAAALSAARITAHYQAGIRQGVLVG